MPAPYPADLVRVVRKGESTFAQIAKDVGISEATLHNWIKKAEIKEGVRPAATESFFSLLQKNVLDRQRWESRE
jgi:transposase